MVVVVVVVVVSPLIIYRPPLLIPPPSHTVRVERERGHSAEDLGVVDGLQRVRRQHRHLAISTCGKYVWEVSVGSTCGQLVWEVSVMH